MVHTGGWQWPVTPAKPHTSVQSLGSSEPPEADVEGMQSAAGGAGTLDSPVARTVAAPALWGVLCGLPLGFDLGQ